MYENIPLISTSPEGRAAKYRGSSDKTVSLSHDSEFGFGVHVSTGRQQTAKLYSPMVGFVHGRLRSANIIADRLLNENFYSGAALALKKMVVVKS